MTKCVGVKDKACGIEFYDPQFPEDTVCDNCASELEEETV